MTVMLTHRTFYFDSFFPFFFVHLHLFKADYRQFSTLQSCESHHELIVIFNTVEFMLTNQPLQHFLYSLCFFCMVN